LEAFLLKDSDKNIVKVFDKQVKDSVPIKTGYKVKEEKEKSSILNVKLYTGKTHQIRAHLSHIGHFIIGDSKYGKDAINREFNAKSQRLSSYKLTLKFNKESPLYYLNNKIFEI
ncbi:MAG: RNA pseudouridine synthase, partial [Firmicutes bacterium]|nr:RNA pseudouridine synthase [Candidatus Caballimonas caccae]